MNASGKIYRIFFFVCFCIRVDGWWWWMCRQGIVMCSLLFRCDEEKAHIFHIIECNKRQQCLLFLSSRTWTWTNKHRHQRDPKFIKIPNDQWHLSVSVPVKNYAFTFCCCSDWRAWRVSIDTRMIHLGAWAGGPYRVDSDKVMCQWRQKDRKCSLICFHLCVCVPSSVYASAHLIICNASNAWQKSRQECRETIENAAPSAKGVSGHNSKAINTFRIRDAHTATDSTAHEIEFILLSC